MSPGGEGEPMDSEAGAERAGRLVAPDGGALPDTDKELFASHEGIDAGAAGSEEAAMHIGRENDLGLEPPARDLDRRHVNRAEALTGRSRSDRRSRP